MYSALELLLSQPAAQDAGGVTAAHDEALVELWSAAGRLVGGEEDPQRQEGWEAHRDVQVRAVAHLVQGETSGDDEKQN